MVVRATEAFGHRASRTRSGTRSSATDRTVRKQSTISNTDTDSTRTWPRTTTRALQPRPTFLLPKPTARRTSASSAKTRQASPPKRLHLAPKIFFRSPSCLHGYPRLVQFLVRCLAGGSPLAWAVHRSCWTVCTRLSASATRTHTHTQGEPDARQKKPSGSTTAKGEG